MKKVSSVLALATLLVVFGVQLNAAQVPALNIFAVAQQDAPQPQSDPQKASDVKVFTGKVMQANGQYVLMDSTTQTTYALDDQEKAKQFEGKAVKVTGTFESSGNLIHISNIEPAA
jgi:Protein of unknown function (DUF5818)